MPLEIVGAGWGRTGTLSLKLALEQLGYPCHHMFEIFLHEDHIKTFTAAGRGEAVDWEAVFGEYRATVDWPGATYWRELTAAYPDAKVILSERDPQQWYESYEATISVGVRGQGLVDNPEWHEMVQLGIVQRDFEGNADDRDHLVALFERHNAEVRATVPPERLLVFEARDGWGPLCAFLGVPVPEGDYPHANDRSQWHKPPEA
ncbi:MAG: sulfotransferase [Actinomycetota bacterium]|nr:sulfotransferase [Actinomycetota bacterium]